VSVREITPGTVYQDEYVSVTAFAVEHANWEHAYGFRFDTSMDINGSQSHEERGIKGLQ